MSARNTGHNALRDWFAAILRASGARALTEQSVAEYAPAVPLRADIRAIHSPGAPAVYYDVVIAHPFTTGVPQGVCGRPHSAHPDPDAAITRAETDKRRDYRAPAGLAAVGFVPLAWDTFGRWGDAAAAALRTAARARLRRPDARQAVRARGAFARLLTRWRAAGAIALQTRNYEVYRDCLAPSGASTTAPRGPPESSAPVPLCDSMSGVLIGSAIF